MDGENSVYSNSSRETSFTINKVAQSKEDVDLYLKQALQHGSVFDGIVYSAGTLIPVYQRYGKQISVRNSLTGENIQLPVDGYILLGKGIMYEVIDNEQGTGRVSGLDDLQSYMQRMRRRTSQASVAHSTIKRTISSNYVLKSGQSAVQVSNNSGSLNALSKEGKGRPALSSLRQLFTRTGEGSIEKGKNRKSMLPNSTQELRSKQDNGSGFKFGTLRLNSKKKISSVPNLLSQNEAYFSRQEETVIEDENEHVQEMEHVDSNGSEISLDSFLKGPPKTVQNNSSQPNLSGDNNSIMSGSVHKSESNMLSSFDKTKPQTSSPLVIKKQPSFLRMFSTLDEQQPITPEPAPIFSAPSNESFKMPKEAFYTTIEGTFRFTIASSESNPERDMLYEFRLSKNELVAFRVENDQFPLLQCACVPSSTGLSLLTNEGKLHLLSESEDDKFNFMSLVNTGSSNNRAIQWIRRRSSADRNDNAYTATSDYEDEMRIAVTDVWEHMSLDLHAHSNVIEPAAGDQLVLLEEARSKISLFSRKIDAPDFEMEIKATDVESLSPSTKQRQLKPNLVKVEDEKDLPSVEVSKYEVKDTVQKEKTIHLTQRSNDGNGVVIVKYNQESDEGTITAGHLPNLLDLLADESPPDENYIDVFLLTYRHIIPATQFLDFFIRRVNLTLRPDADEDQIVYFRFWKPVIILRSVKIVKKWVEQYWPDFIQPELRRHLNSFILLLKYYQSVDGQENNDDYTRSFHSEVHNLGTLLETIVSKKEQKMTILIEPSKFDRPKMEFLDLDYKQIFLALTMNQQERFGNLRPLDFVVHLFGQKEDPQRETQLQALNEMINYFNNVSYWVATEICTQPELKPRVKVVERFIKIAKKCYKYHNFNIMFAIVSAMNNSSIDRLKVTWESTSSKLITSLHELEQLISPEMNYKTYRALLDNIKEKRLKDRVPCIPFFGLFMKDLLFLVDGNPKMLENDLVNFGKLKMIHEKITDLLSFRHYRYNFKVDPLLSEYCNQPRFLKEQALYKYSLLCEGKGESTRLIDKWAKEK